MFSRWLPLQTLIEFCRALRHLHDAGITLAKAMRQQANKGPVRVRPVADRMAARLERGDDLRAAVEDEADHFPPLFISLCVVGEESGRLPEILRELEEYFTLRLTLQREFVNRLIWPMITLGFAVALIGLLVFLRGTSSFMAGVIPDFTFFNLRGAFGTVVFLIEVAAIVAAIWGAYRFFKYKSGIDSTLMKVPVLGSCMQALAVGRFALSMHMMVESGTSVRKAVRVSLGATSNGAFEATGPPIEASIKKGEDLANALAKGGVFPHEFILIMETAEESGRIAEVMKQQARHYYDEAGRRMKMLAQVLALAVALFVLALGGFIVIRFWTGYYGGMIDKLNQSPEEFLRGFGP